MASIEETTGVILRYTNLEKQIWREIYTLMDIKIIKDKLKASARRNNEPLSDDFATQKARDIQYCIKQAKDYFTSSQSSTLIIRPTLIYYGLVSLSAALII